MTQAELIAALPPGRLPPDLMQLGTTDLLALFGMGLLLGCALAALLAPFLARKPSRRARILATRGLPPEERVLAIGRVLGRLPEPLRETAYGVGTPLADREIERIALRARGGRS